MRIVHIPIGVGCCCFIHSRGYARACYKDKANSVPTPFFIILLPVGNRENLIYLSMNYTIQFRYNGKEHILHRSFDREYKVGDSPIILNDLSYSQAVDYLKTEGLWLNNKSIEMLRFYKKGDELLFDLNEFNNQKW